jgi:hypothetical protein
MGWDGMVSTGTLVTAEGTYTGQWAEDRKEGRGKWDGANGETYDGEWHSDLVRRNIYISLRK